MSWKDNFKSIFLGKAAGNKQASAATGTRMTGTLKKRVLREVSFEIKDIRTALTLCNAETPDRSKLFEIFRYIKRDGNLKSQIRVAITKVRSEPWQIYLNGEPDEEATVKVKKRWFNDVIRYIVESELDGFSVVEFWKIDAATGNVAEVVKFNPENISIESQEILIEGTVNGPKLSYKDMAWQYDLLEFGTRKDLGLLLECAYNILWKFYSRSDYSRASEKAGMPVLVVRADTNNKGELDDLEARAANFGTDGYMILQKSDEVDLLERKGQRFHDVYLDNMKYCDSEVSKIINGQTGTSEEKAFAGSAQVHERVLEDITMSRLLLVQDEVNEKLIPYLIYKGMLQEGHTMGYPELIRMEQQRLNGAPTATDAPAAPGDNKKDDAPKK